MEVVALLQKWLKAMGEGLRLRCPKCHTGRMHRTFMEPHERCPTCGVKFQPNEGDFIGGVVVAWSVLAVLLCVGIMLVGWLTNLSVEGHVYLWSAVSTLFLVLGYRNMKGLWVGILYAITDLKEYR
jgi:uncharacterized protein (DUF983 family)